MIEHGRTGFLGETNEELAQYATELVHNEPLRPELADAACSHVEHLADPQPLWTAWKLLFAGLGA